MRSPIVAGLLLALGTLCGSRLGCQRKPVNDPAIEIGAADPSSSDEEVRQELASGAIAGLRAELLDQERVLGAGRISWWTHWRVCWTPVSGAVSYLVTAESAEGAGPPLEVPGLCYSMSVANGIATRSGERAGQSHQLSLMAASLSVTIAARMRDGRLGPASPALPVGREYP